MLRQVAAYSGARVVAAGLQAVALLLVARALEPTDFGVFASVLGALQFIQVFADGGASVAVMRFVNDRSAVEGLLRLSNLLGFASVAISLAFLSAAPWAFDSREPYLMLPLVLWVALERQCEVRSAVLISRDNTTWPSISLILRRVLVVVSVAAAPSSVVFAYSFSSALTAAGAAAALYLVSKDIHAHERFSTVAAARIAVPYWSSQVAQSARQLDLTVLTLFGGGVAAASFAPASRLLAPLLLIPGTYSQVLLSKLAKEERTLRRNDILAPMIASALFYLVLASLTPYWLPLLLGEKYASASLPLMIVIAGLIFATWRAILTVGAQASGQQRGAALAAWAGAATTLAATAAGGVLLGAVGAALASALGFVVQTGAVSRYSGIKSVTGCARRSGRRTRSSATTQEG